MSRGARVEQFNIVCVLLFAVFFACLFHMLKAYVSMNSSFALEEHDDCQGSKEWKNGQGSTDWKNDEYQESRAQALHPDSSTCQSDATLSDGLSEAHGSK